MKAMIKFHVSSPYLQLSVLPNYAQCQLKRTTEQIQPGRKGLLKPDAIHVAGLYTWNQLGHRVKKGEKGIRILVPIIGAKRKAQEEAEKDLTRQNVSALIGFSFR